MTTRIPTHLYHLEHLLKTRANNGEKEAAQTTGNYLVTKYQDFVGLVMQPSLPHFAMPWIRMLAKRLAGLFSIAAAGFCAASIFALEGPERAGAAHGYTALYNLDGKKLADGEFRQWVEDYLLQIVITYKFPDRGSFEEKARFRQQPALIQEHWSWKELKNERL